MGYSPQPSSRYCAPPFPVRRGFIMTRRSRCVHHPALPSCSHRLRISLFSSSTRSSFPCAFEWQFSYKPGRICAQLPLPVPPFIFRIFLRYCSPSAKFGQCHCPHQPLSTTSDAARRPISFSLSSRQPSVVPSIGTSTTYIVSVLSVAPQSPVHAL